MIGLFRRWGWLVGVALAGAGCAPSSTLDRVVARGEIVVGVKNDSPPFGFAVAGETEPCGFDVDLGRKLAAKLGVKPRFAIVTAEDRVAKLLSGEVDLLAASMTITRVRERQVDFSIPYFATQQAFLVKKDSPAKSYGDLAGKKVAVLSGSTALRNTPRIQPDAKLSIFERYDEAFRALEKGDVDALTTDYLILVGLIAKRSGDFRIMGRVGYEPYGLAMRPDDSRFRDRINEVLQELWDEQALQSIMESWFSKNGRYPVDVDFTIATFPKGE